MTICQYFLNGNCRYGDKCWNEHPSGGGRGYSYTAQRNLFGGTAPQKIAFRDSFGNSNNQNPFKWQSPSFQNQGQNNNANQHGRADTNDVIKIFLQEISIWDDSKMWPFSSVAVEKDSSSLPGLEDLSPEEMRLEAYEAQKSGSIQPYVEKVQKMMADVRNKRNELKQASPQMKQNLTKFLEEERTKKSSPSPGSTQNNSRIFGSSSSGGVGLFSQSAGSGQSTAVFGEGSSGIFGSGASSQRGSASAAGGLFGNAANSPQTGSSVFGSTDSSNTGGLFGKSPSNPQRPAGSSVFGSSGTSTGGLFGKGPSTQQSAPSPGFNVNSGSGGLFGKGIATPQPQSSLFGANTTGGLFGKSPSTPQAQTSSLFSSNTQPGFQQTGSVFGARSGSQTPSAPSIFGSDQTNTPVVEVTPFPAPSGSTFGSSPQAVSTPQKTGSTKSSIYSELSELTAEEVEQFQAHFFTLGKIPTKPPPRELIKI